MKDKIHQIKHFLKHYIHARSDLRMHSPYVFRLMNTTLKTMDKSQFWEEIERRRGEISLRNDLVTSPDPGSGSINGSRQTLGQLLKSSATSRQKGQFLARLSAFIRAEKVCELGTSAGIGTAYLYSMQQPAIFTVEGRSEVYEVARETMQVLNLEKVQCLHGLFEDHLDSLAQNGAFDIVYIDGNHKVEPSLRYVNWAKNHLSEQGMIIIDDIYWSPEMTEAWNSIRNSSDVKLSLDFYHFGIISLNPAFREAQHFNLKWPLF